MDVSVIFIFTSIGGLLVVISLPLLMKKIAPNKLFGFRVAATLNNESIWYSANAFCAKYLLGTGVLVSVLPTLLPKLGVTVDVMTKILTGVVVAGVLLSIVATLGHIKKLQSGGA